MPRNLLLVTAALATALAACAPAGTRDLHEVVLFFEDGTERIRWAYGSAATLPLPEGPVADLGDRIGEEAAQGAPYTVAAARSLMGEPFLRDRFAHQEDPPMRVARIPLSSDLRLQVDRDVVRAFAFDGERWYELARDLRAPRTTEVSPVPVQTPLRGVGQLTPAEADAVARGLAAAGEPLVVSFTGDVEVPRSAANLEELLMGREDDRPAWAPRPPDGIDAYRYTRLHVQRGVAVDPAAYRPPGRTALHEVIARGSDGAPPNTDRFVLIRDEAELRTFWNAVHAGRLGDPPALPEVHFGRETVIGVRLAQRPTGGYGIAFDRAVREDDELFIDLRLTEPEEGALVTQALTAPWMLATVLGTDASVVWFRDPQAGTLFAVARDDR